MTIQKLADGIFVDTEKTYKIKNLDAIIFDCDGVLIDVSNSYDLAIKKTVDFMLKKIAGIDHPNIVTKHMIDGFKVAGGFNDEVDVTYSLILSIAAAKKMNEPIPEFINEVTKNADQTGILSVEKYLNSLNVDISEIRDKLAYPGPRDSNLLNSTFDEIFYGTKLYYQLNKREPKFFDGKGLIDNDIVLVKKELIDKLRSKFGRKISIVSGRGVVSAKYSLGELLDEFDLKNSRFLEDEPRENAKPNPRPLVSCIKGLRSSCAVFVGDSMEDYIMARKSEEIGNCTLFCGIYGTSKDPEAKLKLFEQKNADIILETIDLIPKALNLVEA